LNKKAENRLFFSWAVAVLATVASLYLSEVLRFVPCSLCWIQRIFMYPLVILLGIATARRDAHIVPYVMPIVIIGAGFSLYHAILQKLPRHADMPACGPVSCQGDYLNWFGFITIPMLALTAFLLILFALIAVSKISAASKTKGEEK